MTAAALFEERIIIHLFEIVEQTRTDRDETYNYTLMRLIVSAESWPVCCFRHADPIAMYLRSHSTSSSWSQASMAMVPLHADLGTISTPRSPRAATAQI